MLFFSIPETDAKRLVCAGESVVFTINCEPQLITFEDGLIQWNDQRRAILSAEEGPNGLVSFICASSDGDDCIIRPVIA